MNSFRAAACDGKRSFGTWTEAERMARWMTRDKSLPGAYNVYRCRCGCAGFHVGRIDPDQKRVNRRRRQSFFEEGA